MATVEVSSFPVALLENEKTEVLEPATEEPLFLPLLASTVCGRGPLAGGWQPIKNVNDPHVKEIGEFAVAEYNKSSKTNLKFVRVVKGETQVVAGTNYRLDVAAKDGAVTKYYEAVVWEKPWENFRSLTSFNQIKGSHSRP